MDTPTTPSYEAGDIAWTLMSTALVWLMIPGIGYFYSGMARKKNALSLIMLSCCSVAVVSFQVLFKKICSVGFDVIDEHHKLTPCSIHPSLSSKKSGSCSDTL